jgi:hypothetical protein
VGSSATTAIRSDTAGWLWNSGPDFTVVAANRKHGNAADGWREAPNQYEPGNESKQSEPDAERESER